MAVDICNRIAGNLTSTKCPSSGGLNRRSWTFQKEQFTGAETRNPTSGALSGFTLEADELGIRGKGRPKRGSGASKSTKTENGGTEVEQTLIQEYGFKDQKQLDLLETFLAADGKVVFQELASGKIRVFFKAYGNESDTGEEGTGETLTAENGIMKITMTGKEPKFPMFFEAPISGQLSQLESSAAYLDALTSES
jgi:hypothetical protein